MPTVKEVLKPPQTNSISNLSKEPSLAILNRVARFSMIELPSKSI